jgi:hypothetical protein
MIKLISLTQPNIEGLKTAEDLINLQKHIDYLLNLK